MHFIFYDLTFGVWWKILGFSKSKRLLQNFWDGFCVFYLKTSCITFHLHYNNVSCILRCVFTLLQTCVLVGLDWVKPMMQLLLHVTCSCIPMHTYFLFNTFWYYFAAWDFSDCLFLPLSFLFGLIMRRPNRTSLRTSLDEAFIWNAKSFCRISPTLTYPLSFTVGVRSHYVMSWSLIHLYLSRSFTPTCKDLII